MRSTTRADLPPSIMASNGLLTPVASSEIQAKPAVLASPIDASFSLPPAAMLSNTPSTRDSSVTPPTKAASESSFEPSPVTTVPTRSRQTAGSKRKSGSGTQQEYALPPPPTRSRKIIQMKPKSQPAGDSPEASTTRDSTSARKSQPMIAPAPPASKSTAQISSAPSAAAATTGGRRKQSNASGPTTAAGRKMARKTAHSLIERRRRSKMNEEFGVLKDMIPACAGQDMHKLAILQASIEYMRYLEKCLADLKAVHGECPRTQSESSYRESGMVSARSDNTTPVSQDTEMQDLPPLRSAIPAAASVLHPHARLPSISPAILPLTRSSSTQASPYHGAVTFSRPISSAHGSALPSPAFEPLNHSYSNSSQTGFRLTSPAMSPTQLPEDHEVTTALLMLNTDRRSWSEAQSERPRESARRPELGGPSAPRGFSVRDLLTE
jgi:helix-loop-helix DNA-binding protein